MSDSLSAPRDDADARAWFYLDHRHDIETWVGLRADGRQLLDKHLVGIAVLLEELAEEVDAELETNDLDSGSWPRVGLRRPSWLHRGIGDVTVVVEWERARLLTPGSNEWPYLGVRLPSDATDEVRRRQISEAMKPVRSQLKGFSSPRLPFWRYVQLPADNQLDLDAFLRSLLAYFRQLWEVAAPILDAIHSGSTDLEGQSPQLR